MGLIVRQKKIDTTHVYGLGQERATPKTALHTELRFCTPYPARHIIMGATRLEQTKPGVHIYTLREIRARAHKVQCPYTTVPVAAHRGTARF